MTISMVDTALEGARVNGLLACVIELGLRDTESGIIGLFLGRITSGASALKVSRAIDTCEEVTRKFPDWIGPGELLG